ncbi:hypothetical protein FH039_11290 [Thermococcus indicus]|uniref:Uncharacterized protein n=1 Tax=Thermococcus indicus TaxID=2586643 RepID=A0A4Y5SME9_9EURY|nr:hypothetical protein [Thermococcus indicus]QDA32066.1 hypothetical protein FH039_11290 [Thermococcus indicus]
MKRIAIYTIGFVIMTLIAALDFVLFLGRLLSLSGRWMPFVVSLPMVMLGGYVGWEVGMGLGFNDEEVASMGTAVSVISGFLILLLFLL